MGALSDDEFEIELTELIPPLRAFARTMTHNLAQAEDLAQDALARAWKSRASFEAGTNMKAWAFVILRNNFYSECRRTWRIRPLSQEVAEQTLTSVDDPSGRLELVDVRRAMLHLSSEHREAITLVGAAGMSYEDAASVMGCAIGTVKSRVSRARECLRELLVEGDLQDCDVPPNATFGSFFADAARFREHGGADLSPQLLP